MHRGKRCAGAVILTAAVSMAAGTVLARLTSTHEMTLEEALTILDGKAQFSQREKDLLCGVFLRSSQRAINSMERLGGERFLKKLAEQLRKHQ